MRSTYALYELKMKEQDTILNFVALYKLKSNSSWSLKVFFVSIQLMVSNQKESPFFLLPERQGVWDILMAFIAYSANILLLHNSFFA